MTRLTVTARITSDGEAFAVTGREAWALVKLIKAGPHGCTAFDSPGPRWSAYVHALRHEHGLAIETLREPHQGAFPGTHARYVLRSPVQLLLDTDGSERATA